MIEDMFKLFKNQYFYLGLILILAFLVRLYKIDAPIADWHSWRQADTASVTRNFIKEGFNPLYPKFDDMSGISENPIINSNRFRFVEFPIYNIFVYPLYLLFGMDESLHRLVSVIFSLSSLVFVYLITKRYIGTPTAFVCAFVSALLPFNVFFSRTTLPEPTFLFFALGMVYFVDRVVWESRVIWGIWGFIFTALAFLIKPWAIFFVPPLVYSILVKSKNGPAFAEASAGEKGKSLLKYFLFFILAITPFILWRLWILQQSQGIPASSWLLNSDGIRFRPSFFWWIVSERLGREIFGVSGFALFIIGVLIKQKNHFLHIWLLSIFLYFIIFATGNVRHNYYQLIFVPIGVVFLSIGFVALFKGINNLLPRIWTIPLALSLLILSFYFTYKIDKEFYKINNPQMIDAGSVADKILPKDAIVLAPYNGDSAFLYQTNRAGFPYSYLPIKEMIADYGVTHYVSVSKDAKTSWVARHFQTLVEDEKFVIADLTKLTVPFDDKVDPEP